MTNEQRIAEIRESISILKVPWTIQRSDIKFLLAELAASQERVRELEAQINAKEKA